MFESVDWPQQGILFLRGVFWYFVQLVFSYPATYIASMPITAFLARQGLSGDHGPGVHFAGYEVLGCLLLGPSVGWAVGRFKPSLVRTGCWIWILPVAVVVPDAVRESRHSSLARLPEYFFTQARDPGLAVYLLMLPTSAAVGYSLGMVLLSLNDIWPSATRLRSVFRLAVLLLAAGVSLGFLGVKLRDFERQTFERRAKIRLTISDALQVSPDPLVFCKEYRPSRRLPLLPPRTVVEKLDRRACLGDEVVDADTPPPLTKDHYSLVGIEKIRVVEGIDAGLVGWVLVSGLSNTE
jgi:hypothetical protein